MGRGGKYGKSMSEFKKEVEKRCSTLNLLLGIDEADFTRAVSLHAQVSTRS